MVLHHVLEFVAEVFEEALHGPRGGIAERADRMTLDLVGYLDQLVEVFLLALPVDDAGQHAVQPAGALATRRALAAGLRHVET